LLKIKLLCLIACTVFIASTAQATPGTHAHFAAFFNNGSHADFSFPDTVVGNAIEPLMHKKGGEMMLFAHSVAIQDGDVFSIQNDILREVEGSFQDFGLNCQITIHTQKIWEVSGMCEKFLVGKGKSNQSIMPTAISKQLIWYKIFEDKEHGMAGYFMKEKGQDFEK